MKKPGKFLSSIGLRYPLLCRILCLIPTASFLFSEIALSAPVENLPAWECKKDENVQIYRKNLEAQQARKDAKYLKEQDNNIGDYEDAIVLAQMRGREAAKTMFSKKWIPDFLVSENGYAALLHGGQHGIACAEYYNQTPTAGHDAAFMASLKDECETGYRAGVMDAVKLARSGQDKELGKKLDPASYRPEDHDPDVNCYYDYQSGIDAMKKVCENLKKTNAGAGTAGTCPTFRKVESSPGCYSLGVRAFQYQELAIDAEISGGTKSSTDKKLTPTAEWKECKTQWESAKAQGDDPLNGLMAALTPPGTSPISSNSLYKPSGETSGAPISTPGATPDAASAKLDPQHI